MLLRRGLLVLVLLLAGCAVPAASAAIATGAAEHALRVGGLDRSYRTYRPASLPAGRAVALLVVLHGGLGSAREAERRYGWNAEADRGGFVVVYPDGVGHTWNAGPGCCGRAVKERVDDVGFIERLVATVSERMRVDPARVYVTGISNGGMMAYRLACEGTVFAAIAPVAGTLMGDCSRTAPLSLIHVHGTADPTVPYAGGPGDRNNGDTVDIDGPAVPDLVATWRVNGSCPAPAEHADGPVVTSAAACPGGHLVELVTIDGGGHRWPAIATATISAFLRLR